MITSALGGNWVTFISKTNSEDVGVMASGELPTKKCWFGVEWDPRNGPTTLLESADLC